MVIIPQKGILVFSFEYEYGIVTKTEETGGFFSNVKEKTHLGRH